MVPYARRADLYLEWIITDFQCEMSYLFSISHDFLEVNHHIYSTIFPRFFTINSPFFRTGNPNVPQFLDPAPPVAAFAAQGADAAGTARTDEGEAISQLKHG